MRAPWCTCPIPAVPTRDFNQRTLASAMTISPRHKVLLPFLIALWVAGATLAYERVAVLSRNPVVAGAEKAVSYLLLPRIIGAAVLGGNAHVFSLWLAAGVNAVLCFVAGWIVCILLGKLSEKKAT